MNPKRTKPPKVALFPKKGQLPEFLLFPIRIRLQNNLISQNKLTPD